MMPQQIDEKPQSADARKHLLPYVLTAMYITRSILRIFHSISGSAEDIDSILEDPALVFSIVCQVMNMINRLQKHLDRKKDCNQAS